MKKTGENYRSACLRRLSAITAGTLFVVCQSALAAGGDFSFDFTAAAPLTYAHATGGGAYNDRTVGRDQDIVESLEGGDFACGDTVTFLTQIRVGAAAPGAQTIRLRLSFTASSTGQQGVALVDNVNGVSAAINGGGIDSGTVDDGGSTVTVVDEAYDGTIFAKPTWFQRTVDVTDLEAAEKVVVRSDVRIACNGGSPTGNLLARLTSASVAAPQSELGGVRVGSQTIPLQHASAIVPPPQCGPNGEICN